jgi:glycine/D-amino acid oxidase-like deaminating enzyme
MIGRLKNKPVQTKRLRVAIVGGGIGGLSAASALFRRGIEVTVLEQARALGEVGAGVSIFPNGLRQLERIGLGDALAEVGAKVENGSEYYRMYGTVVGQILTTDYEAFRRERTDVIQAEARRNGLRYDSRYESLEQRDQEIADTAGFREWLYDYDVEKAAIAYMSKSGLSRARISGRLQLCFYHEQAAQGAGSQAPGGCGANRGTGHENREGGRTQPLH